MQARLKGLERIALAYAAMKRAQELSLQETAAAVREVELRIEQQSSLVRRTWAAGRAALNVGAHEAWKMHESQNQFTERTIGPLIELRGRREALLFEAAEVYRAGKMQLEQMESVLRGLRSQLETEDNRRAQRESDDRFLARSWWQEQAADIFRERSGEPAARLGELTGEAVGAEASGSRTGVRKA